MLAMVLTILTAAPSSLPATRATRGPQNPLYASLIEHGVALGPDLRAKLPPPTMPDGLDGARQKAVIAALIKDDHTYAEFTRKSVVAPQRIRLRDVAPCDRAAPARGADVWFVAYDDRYLRWLMGLRKGDGLGGGKRLTREELTRRGVESDESREAFRHVEFDLPGKVQIKATVRATWSMTGESVLIAAEVDPRFRGDAEFPNQWRATGGLATPGAAGEWNGAGFYLKITKLAEPAGALFVEQHIVFAEPTGWFDGANLLRPKLPMVMQNQVRALRGEWTAAGGK